MSISLSSAELALTAQLSRLLLSPLDHPTPDHWRSAVNRGLKELLGADSAGFHLPGAGAEVFYTDDFSHDEMDAYPDVAPPPLADGTDIVEHTLRLGVGTLRGAYGADAGRFLESEYHNEYGKLLGKCDTLFAIHSLPGRAEGEVACLQLFRGQQRTHQFGEREVQLLRLVAPAFNAGVEMHARWGRQRAELLDTLDALGQAALVCSPDGAALHQTPLLTELLSTEPDGVPLRAALLRMMDAVRGGSVPLPAEVRAPVARYALRACRYGGPGGGEAVVVVSVERTTPAPFLEADLQARYSLTPAEIRVARLLAQGFSNDALARQLCISPHTARRHTERVMNKLNIRSRAEVATRLLGA